MKKKRTRSCSFLLMMVVLSLCSTNHHAFRVSRSQIRPRAMATKVSVMAASQPPQQENATVHSSMPSVDNWRNLPSLNPTLHFGSWIVPTQSISIQQLLDKDILQPYLGTRVKELRYMRRRLKLVQEYKHCIPGTKLILTHPDTPSLQQLPQPVLDYLQPNQKNITDGPSVAIDFTYTDFQVQHLLETLLPKEVHPVPSAYEQVGHVAHLNLHPMHLPYRFLIGQALLLHPHIETVIHKVGQVSGPYRTYDYELLAGRNATIVTVVENRLQLRFDLAKVYWCTRLHQERRRLLQSMLRDGRGGEVQQQQILADPFCGIGSLCLQAAQAGMKVLANDWNPDAIAALNENAKMNQIENIRAHCGDAYDFMVDLGVTDRTTKNQCLPHHVVMNYPLESVKFLGALRWWPTTANTIPPRLHIYLFAHDDSDERLSAEDVAINTIADHLLPSTITNNDSANNRNSDSDDQQQLLRRRHELNTMFGCRIVVHHVRNVAPGKMVFCVSLTATQKLLRHMQGDFV